MWSPNFALLFQVDFYYLTVVFLLFRQRTFSPDIFQISSFLSLVSIIFFKVKVISLNVLLTHKSHCWLSNPIRPYMSPHEVALLHPSREVYLLNQVIQAELWSDSVPIIE